MLAPTTRRRRRSTDRPRTSRARRSRRPSLPRRAIAPDAGGSGPPTRRRPVAVAITGGIGAGKTELLKAFERHGAAVISSDDIVHRLLREDPKVKRAIRERFGEGVVGADGEIDRSAVAAIVFGDRQKLTWLEQLLHPRVIASYLGWRDELARRPHPPDVCVTEVPLLYEVQAEERFDAVVAVTASAETRAARLFRPVVDRERRLLPDEQKLERADFAFVNDGSLGELEAFVSDVMAKLTDA